MEHKHILVVDDESQITRVLRTSLSTHGYDIRVANDGETALGIAGVFAAGMLLCLLVRLSGALWLGIGFHTAWDWAQSYLYGVPDSGTMIEGHLLISHAMGDTRFSGGTVGPEGSVFAMPVLVAGLVVLSWAYRKTGLAGR